MKKENRTCQERLDIFLKSWTVCWQEVAKLKELISELLTETRQEEQEKLKDILQMSPPQRPRFLLYLTAHKLSLLYQIFYRIEAVKKELENQIKVINDNL